MNSPTADNTVTLIVLSAVGLFFWPLFSESYRIRHRTGVGIAQRQRLRSTPSQPGFDSQLSQFFSEETYAGLNDCKCTVETVDSAEAEYEVV
jgi:hypothetical protein